ncbi:MAG: hypothetical protein J6P84_02045 [Alphaproteobacteria bacterium]|nr:hypothetical protein [Alphaproteobacteria bacterium]MBO7642470.1 hypothetical protein [Alphaproteobacteria bacterium]
MLKKIFPVILNAIEKIISGISRVAPTIIEMLKKTVILIAEIVCAIAPIVWRMVKGIVLSVIHIIQAIIDIVNQRSKSQ